MNSVFLVITGPSGAGKSSVAERILARVPGSVRLITTTTRTPRPDETDGKDYFFCSREDFKMQQDREEFLEWEENYGNLYGSSRNALETLLAEFPLVISVPDARGARATKLAFPQAVTVFITPGSIDELKTRLENRPGAKPEDTATRLKFALRILEQSGDFDHMVVNARDKLEEAADAVIAILKTR
jgi:guanylate kinase